MPIKHTETLWDIEPHTKAKHEILKRYLNPWFVIMGKWNDLILFVDGFAGPGRYQNDEPGSPKIACNAAIQNKSSQPNSRIKLLFNEEDSNRFEELENWAAETKPLLPDKVDIYARNMNFADLATEIVSGRQSKKQVPTFAFIDPFGFKDVPLDLISKLVEHEKSELFILFSFNAVNRWIKTKSQKDNLDALFGCEDYSQCDGMSPPDRKIFLADLYERQLKKVCRFEYVSRFEMKKRDGNRTSYFLYHCTRNLKGLEVMKDAMWAVDPETGSQFSYRIEELEPLFEVPLDLDKILKKEFRGKTVPVEELEKYVLTDTRYARKHLRKGALLPMEQRGEIEIQNRKRKNTFPRGSRIKFSA
ncbi:three-Cys-motif partner protein TcmP [Corynebacterium sp. S7]